MASRAPITSTFIAKLLAPLPEAVEQANDRRFLRQLQIDLSERWWRQMTKTRRAEHLRLAQEENCGTPECWAYHAPCAEQMLVPAPDRAALKWKRAHRRFEGGRPDWEAQIAADEAWLGG